MKLWKYIVGIILLWILMFSIIVPKLIKTCSNDIDKLIEMEFTKQVSELMRDEIIRQLNKKQGYRK